MIYLASPYYHAVEGIMEGRYQSALKFCAESARQGINIYSPIVHWHPVAKAHDLPRGHKFWRQLNHEMIKLSDEVWILRIPGRAESAGVADELAYAESLHRRVRLVYEP